MAAQQGGGAAPAGLRGRPVRGGPALRPAPVHGAPLPGDDCGWLFLDQNGLRQWCSMGICGARAERDQTAALCA